MEMHGEENDDVGDRLHLLLVNTRRLLKHSVYRTLHISRCQWDHIGSAGKGQPLEHEKRRLLK